MLNRVVLIGRLVRDPELRYSSTGIAVANFTVACDRKFTNQDGEREADFIPVVTWRGLAETVANYTRKGSLVGLEGRLQVRSYENQEGRTVWVTEVVADDVRFLDYRNKNESDQQPQQQTNGRRSKASYKNDPFGDGVTVNISDDDLPF
jgi:single-strand DNA-binding protein